MSRQSLPRKAASAVSRYLRAHPEEFVRAAKNVAELQVGVPLPAIRWLIRELGGKKTPRDLVLEARSPGIFVSAKLELMKTELAASAVLLIENVDWTSDALLVDLRITDLKLQVLDSTALSPIAALLRSGALDLSRPGDLVSYLPKGSPILLEAKGDRFKLDLLRHPKLSAAKARKIVSILAPLVSVRAIRTRDDHLDVKLAPLPQGAREALESLKKLF